MSRPFAVRRTTRFAGIVAALAALVIPISVFAEAPRAEAATLSGAQFDPGRIIDDALFYDRNAMTTNEIQAFLDSKIGSCSNGQCLNVYSVDYGGRARDVSANGNVICEAVPAGRYSIAHLIFTAQQACGISAKVILVTMQKEQSLVTSKSPSLTQLARAMGNACPDTAPCNPNAAGVANQIVGGTRQLKAYGHSQGSGPGTLFGRPVGTQYIGYSPNSSCGGTNVNVQNKATAALYTYTPYQPNAAALANLRGTGDGCSSYGNRNFWVFWNDWFGSPTNPAPDRIEAAFAAAGGDGGWLGPATSGFQCGLVNGGCVREHQNGALYASYTTMGNPVSGAHRTYWNSQGAQNGVLGYPTSGVYTGLINGGVYQNFENGTVYTHPGGTFSVRGGIKSAWVATGSEWGSFGYPLSDELKVATGGVYQQFERGRIYWTAATGAMKVPAATAELMAKEPWIGAPTGDQKCGLVNNGCSQMFTGGAVYTSEGGTWAVRGGIRSAWVKLGAENSRAGYPRSLELPRTGGGVYQLFDNGRIHWTAATGAIYTPAATVEAMNRFGWLGAPTSDHLCGLVKDGCYQVFQGGVLYTSEAGVWPVRGGVLDAWSKIGKEWGKAGYPRSVEIAFNGGVYQEFDKGRIYWSAKTGAHFVPTASVEAMGRFPWLGFPSSDHLTGLIRGGAYQVFQNGVLYTSEGGVWPVRGGVLDAWAKLNKEWGKAGYPLSAEIPTDTGVYQQFENGRIVWTSRTGATTYVAN